MKQINLNYVDWTKLWCYLSIIILIVLLFNQCDNNENLKLKSTIQEKEIMISKEKIDKYVKANNELNEKLIILTKESENVKKIYVDRIKKVYIEKKKVDSFTTSDFSKYYSKRYDSDVLVCSKGVILDDVTASKNVKELYDKDIMELDLYSTKKQLNLEESKGLIKDTIISNMSFIVKESENQIEYKNQIIKNTEKSLKSEKIKKNFWKLATIGVLGGATYLLIAN